MLEVHMTEHCRAMSARPSRKKRQAKDYFHSADMSQSWGKSQMRIWGGGRDGEDVQVKRATSTGLIMRSQSSLMQLQLVRN